MIEIVQQVNKKIGKDIYLKLNLLITIQDWLILKFKVLEI